MLKMFLSLSASLKATKFQRYVCIHQCFNAKLYSQAQSRGFISPWGVNAVAAHVGLVYRARNQRGV